MLRQFAGHLQKCVQEADETMRALFTEVRRETWREIVATVFELDLDDIPTLDPVEARELMHKVSSKMVEPAILMEIQKRSAKIQDDNDEMLLAKKHELLQDILINDVYLGGSPSLTEEAGFGSGPASYAKMQCALTDHEGDPLMAQYAASAMIKIFQAAGIDVDSINGPGLSAAPTAPGVPT
jgi:hypothetical protein